MSDKKIKLWELIQSKGLLFPTNSTEIIEFEKQNIIQKENPSDWDNPFNIILRGHQKLDNVQQGFIPNIELENLAMAAREGKSIPLEVRKKMNEDRANAKK